MLILVLIAIALITLAIRTEVKSNRAHKKNNAHTEREPKSIEVKQYKQYSINFTKEVFNDFVSLDFETTGLSANIDKIIEVAATKYCNGKIVDEFHSLIYPEIHIPSRITKINNIDDSMVNGCPRISEIVPKLLEFIGDLPIVAHNASLILVS
ncbi:exonuclease domain-containing protein [Clostridium sp. DMHC 10]|uniref:3'-5' exonuclease n=1 Tax=Clostridium sp. DMHC 10 TaxID=747377 RepID=UPI00069E49AE|nr:exonuclease domain-containing protein [Clostridium sp. DMHC 10]